MNNKVNEKNNRKVYKERYRRGLSKYGCQMLWTAMWLSFVAFLCFMFNTGAPLGLLFIWFIGFCSFL